MIIETKQQKDARIGELIDKYVEKNLEGFTHLVGLSVALLYAVSEISSERPRTADIYNMVQQIAINCIMIVGATEGIRIVGMALVDSIERISKVVWDIINKNFEG